MIRRLLPLFALALGQAALTVGLTAFVFSSEMSRFGTGTPAPPSVHIASALVGALACPVLPLVAQLPLTLQPSGFPAEHLTFLANGLVWAAGILALRRLWLRRTARTRRRVVNGQI
ncbi:MAG: hypothetical protein ACREA0_10775 [bacterium]